MSSQSERVPTTEQRLVIEAAEPSFTVIASAGAGKTFVLVERYLRHIENEGLKPDQILTITFTKKAAAEMKQRIVDRLRTKGRLEEAQVAETGPIQTIHSFCERLLRENALEAGLDPKYEILATDHAKRLITSCIREAMATANECGPEAEELLRTLAGKPQGFGANQSPYIIIENAVESVLHELRGSRFDQGDILARYSDVTTLKATWEDGVRNMLPQGAVPYFDEIEDADMNRRVQGACKGASVSVPGWARGRSDSVAEDESLRQTCGLVQLACDAWHRLDREMSELQALDFSALEIRAYRLLERSEVTRLRIQDQYKVVMVDESQDVNPIQYKLLDKLGCTRTMFVGDAQQSIYGFRQADVRLFRSRSEKTATKKLTKNWRSAPGILSFVDMVFARLWSGEYSPMLGTTGPMDFDSEEKPSFSGTEVWNQASKSPKATASYVKQLLDEGVKQGDIAILTRDGAAALGLKLALDAENIACRIAGGSEKFYTRIEVCDLANTLKCLADPYDDFALLATLRSPMVGLSMDSIVLLGKTPFFVDQLKEFSAPFEEDRSKLESFLAWYLPLREYADRLSAWEVLAEIYAKSDYLAALARKPNGDQMLANSRKLLSLAAQAPELGPLEYSERIREIQDLRHKEGDAPSDDNDADLVKIMTIHKAKGLEWPVVILGQTDKTISSIAKAVVVEPAAALVATKFGSSASLMHKLLTERKKQRESDEEKRILYVALTRAKERLCITIVPNGRTMTVSKLLDGVADFTQLDGLKIRSTHASNPSGV